MSGSFATYLLLKGLKEIIHVEMLTAFLFGIAVAL